METTNCIACNFLLPTNVKFCSSCGTKQKCQVCNAPLSKDSKFCTDCGASVDVQKTSPEKNIVVFRKTAHEIFYEVSLTDEVGKEGINGLIQSLTSQQQIKNTPPLPPETTGIEDIPHTDADSLIEDQKDNVQKEKSNIAYPHVNDIEMKLSLSESKWLLVYAFYKSDFGIKTFTKEAVITEYLNKRGSDIRKKNLSTNWKTIYKEFFETVREGELKIKANKMQAVIDMLTGEPYSKGGSTSAKRKKKKSASPNNEDEKKPVAKKIAKAKNSTASRYVLNPDLNLIPKDKKSFVDFSDEYKPKKAPEAILIIVYYLQKILGKSNIGINDIYTCYKQLPLVIPNIESALGNIKVRNGFIDTSNFANLRITTAGENHIEHTMKKIKK